MESTYDGRYYDFHGHPARVRVWVWVKVYGVVSLASLTLALIGWKEKSSID
jgi:hypothetical protein